MGTVGALSHNLKPQLAAGQALFEALEGGGTPLCAGNEGLGAASSEVTCQDSAQWADQAPLVDNVRTQDDVAVLLAAILRRIEPVQFLHKSLDRLVAARNTELD